MATARTAHPRPVVLVHGAFHGAWCWAALQADLDRRGIPSYAVDLPGHGASAQPLADLHGDADTVARLLDRLDAEVVLVGHSYGGAVISEAGLAGRVGRLVYLAAIVLDEGESATDAVANLPRTATTGSGIGSIMVRGADGRMRPNLEAAAAVFYNACPPEAAAAAVARLDSQRAATMRQPATVAAWRQRPATYVRCLQDHALTVAMQDAFAARCGDVVTIDADHSPFIGAPAPLADILAGLSAG